MEAPDAPQQFDAPEQRNSAAPFPTWPLGDPALEELAARCETMLDYRFRDHGLLKASCSRMRRSPMIGGSPTNGWNFLVIRCWGWWFVTGCLNFFRNT